MIIEEVVERLEDLLEFNHEPTPMDIIALGIAIIVLHKQIPQKPCVEHRQYICPECRTKLVTYNWSGGTHYCHHCGQVIDWSDEV